MEKHTENQGQIVKKQISKGKTITQKIIEAHLVSGVPITGNEIDIRVDQTLTHDINAVMTYLAFEGLDIDRVRTKCSVSYLDHNLLCGLQDTGRSYLSAIRSEEIRCLGIQTGKWNLSYRSCVTICHSGRGMCGWRQSHSSFWCNWNA